MHALLIALCFACTFAVTFVSGMPIVEGSLKQEQE